MRWLRLLVALPFLFGAAVPDPLAISDGQVKDGKGDIAVIIAVSDYLVVQDVPGAEANAVAWQRYLSEVRGVPVVKLLRGLDVTRENVLEQVSALASTTSGRAWVVFVGHGAPSYDPQRPDARLLMMDAMQTDKSIMSRSLGRKELLDAVGSKRPEVVAVIDACYSGSFADGAAKVAGQPTPPVSSRIGTRATVLTAAEANQIAGELPGHGRPAFSWLVLGGLRGWADADGSRTVTASELTAYATSTLTSVLTSRVQTPTLEAEDEGVVLSRPTAPAAAPDLVVRVAAAPVYENRAFDVVLPGVGAALAADLEAQRLREAEAERIRKAEEEASRKRQQELACAEEERTGAEAASGKRVEAAKAAVRREATAAWRGIEGDMRACVEVKDKALRLQCVSVVDEYVRWAEGLRASVEAASDSIPTACGARVHVSLSRLEPVDVAEVSVARDLKGQIESGSVGGTVVRHVVKGVAFEGVVVPGGTFTMGSPASEAGRGSDEGQVQVTLTRGMEVMRTEVTQGLYAAVMGKNPSEFSSCGATCPVEQVSWDDAVAFAKALNAAEGLAAGTWRLPTEAEWEWAARGGQGTAYAGSNESGSVAWTTENSGSKTHAVCGRAVNGWGLCDMSGNVWEWVSDRYASSLSGGRDPKGPDADDFRVFRGGGWSNPARYARVASRSGYAPDYRFGTLGFRLVRSTLGP